MHRISASPGGWHLNLEGVITIEQTPAAIAFLSAADTDIQTLAAAVPKLPVELRSIRVANLLQLQQQLTVDTYAEQVLASARAIVLRLLGGRSYWSYGLEVLKETVEKTGADLIVLPGDDRPDPHLMGHSTVSLTAVNQVWRYFTEGGIENFANALKFVADVCLEQNYNPPPPQAVPRVGYYPRTETKDEITSKSPAQFPRPQVGILFYRAHYLAGNTAPVDGLCQGLVERNLEPIPVFVSSLRDKDVRAELLSYFQPLEGQSIRLLLNTTSFSLARWESESPQLDLWQALDVPVLQVILSSSTVEQWESGFAGLTPRDVAMNVALPEVDGRIISRAVSFKAVQTWNSQLETDVVVYQPARSRLDFVADLAANWIRLQNTPISQRKIALILANYPTRDGRLANGVGLDTPASCVEILKALQTAGYRVENSPATGDELIQCLTAGITNDPESQELRPIHQQLSVEEYNTYWETLPQDVQTKIKERWGEVENRPFPIPGIQLGNVFVGIQPARGYDRDPSLNYHAPDLEPTHTYLAFYYWVRSHFQTHAVVHVGKHGNLEWLPGKSVALSPSCYPEIALGAMPHFYPFIVNDPGDGSQAKRRSQAVLIDHLTPPMTRAELYGGLQQLETLIDEYYQAESLDPSRLGAIRDRLTALLGAENLHQDLSFVKDSATDDRQFTEFLAQTDGYLCELKEAQIRDGLHILGQCPQGRQLRDLIVAISRGRPKGITRALAEDIGFDFDPLTADPAERIVGNTVTIFQDKCYNVGKAIALLEEKADELVEQTIEAQYQLKPAAKYHLNLLPKTQKELDWIASELLPALEQTNQEITQLLRGLEGRYIPSGAAGAPTRGRPEVLPTGRNFYSVDIRAIPTETAWEIGRKAAEMLIERYTQENGEYPQSLGLSVWGTSTMRTGGDDIAEALALLGVQPVWDGISRRVVDFEILPVESLGRPRVDVTLRISGFFRDAFPNLIDLFDTAVARVAELDEKLEDNPLASQVRKEKEFWLTAGLGKDQAERRARYRVFGSKPGAYGAGLQGLIESQNWTSDRDLARAYINWSSYAYTGKGTGYSAPEAFEQRLQQMQVVLHNQDNREHDLLDSDDYYQFQGGLTAAVRSLRGKNPQTYFGDNSVPQNPRVRQLREEIARVYRSRVVNPKWIAGAMRHGYKGAFEIAATVDYLFAYDATANCVEDYMYRGVSETYIFDRNVQDFIQQKNPWALRDMAERLLEAHQRGLWKNVESDRIEKLRAIAHQAEGAIEGISE